MQEIADWLDKLGMSEYAQRFADERVDFSVLKDLTDQDLKDLGVVLGDRRKILRAIAKLDATPEAVTPISRSLSTPLATAQPVAVTEERSDRRDLTVLVCNLLDPSGLAAKLDPEEWLDVVDAYLNAASAVITDLGGTLAEKLDSGLMALFGYPTMQENDAARAVRAALATQRALTELNRTNVNTPLALAACIFIDSVPIVIDAASEMFGDLPDSVTQAQSLAEQGVVVVTARVQRQVTDLFVAKEYGTDKLKGAAEAVTLYRIVRPTGGAHRRRDYDRLLARAVKGVDMSSAEARQAVYERARKALVAQLRFNQPALEKADIAKERLALEEAIRKVEAEVARKSRNEIVAVPRPARRPAGAPDGNPPPADAPWAAWPAEVLPDFREQLFSELSSPKRRAAKEFREIQDLEGTDKAAESTRQNREVYEQAPEDLPAEEPTVISFDQPDPHQFDAGQERDPEPAYEPEERPLVVRPVWTPTIAPADKDERTRPALSYGALARLVVVLIVLAGVVATTSWQWSSITEAYRLLSHTGSKPQPKFSGSLRQERDIGRSPGTALLGGRTAATVAQQVVLHEEDRNDQQHRQYTGSAIWHTELVSPGAVPELVVRADAEVPERRMTVAWSLRRNIDKSLPASHTIEIKFNVPADFPGGGIANVSGILMAQAEETRGNPLAGLAVKVTDGLFIIGLSAVDPEMQRNEQLIKGRSWFYIPIVYTNGGRAILAMKKGPPGDRALAEAFAAWEKK